MEESGRLRDSAESSITSAQADLSRPTRRGYSQVGQLIRFWPVKAGGTACVKVVRGRPVVPLRRVWTRSQNFFRSGGKNGMSLTEFNEQLHGSMALDVVERLASQSGWAFERAGEDEITILVGGQWTDYQLSFTWMENIEVLHLACAFDLKAPDRRRSEVLELVAQVNEQLWIGHFDFWAKDGLVMYRHALMLPGGASPSNAQCAALLSAALDACERYYQAFQFVLWAGKTAREAIEATMFETSGEA